MDDENNQQDNNDELQQNIQKYARKGKNALNTVTNKVRNIKSPKTMYNKKRWK